VECPEQLIIALTAITVLLGDSRDIALQALAFQEHEEAMGL